jgi:hypothetical protein
MIRQIELWGERIIPAVNKALAGDRTAEPRMAVGVESR